MGAINLQHWALPFRSVATSLVLIMALAGCQANSPPESATVEPLGNERTLVYKTSSGKRFTVVRDFSMGSSMNGIKVIPSGFSKSNQEWDLGFIDPLESVFLADLDGNQYEELYLVTRSVGSGSYASIHALVSNRDRSATPAYVRTITAKQRQAGQPFEGFMGHNKFLLSDGQLFNEFPVYQQGDSNAKASGGTRRVAYYLTMGEAGWILETQCQQP